MEMGFELFISGVAGQKIECSFCTSFVHHKDCFQPHY